MAQALSLGDLFAEVGERRVKTCYDFFDCVLPQMGVWDLTDGMYEGDTSRPYDEAQQRQLAYLLDQTGCTAARPGFRLLDIGCGNGKLLAAAKERRARPCGITVSPCQAARCRAQALTVWLMDWRELDASCFGLTDGIVANGSIEHFVQPEDAAAGRADGVYTDLFRRCFDLLVARGSRLVTTTIHWRGAAVPPDDFLTHPLRHRRGSPAFHFSMLHHTLGGYYPSQGQLERCAALYFRLLDEVDGTQDYHWTSEEWLRRARRAFLHPAYAGKTWLKLLPFLGFHLHQSALIILLLLSESWQWQFRGDNPPVRLLRQTWERM